MPEETVLPTGDDVRDFAFSTNGEEYVEGWCDFLDQNDDLVAGQSCYRGVVARPDPATYMDVDSILERMGEQAYEDGGEWAEDYPRVTDEAKAELKTLLDTWARKHCQPTFFLVEGVETFSITAEDLENADEVTP